jgi:hypothetical protein
MQATFGANAVGLAHINSATEAVADHAGGAVGYAALWRAHVQAPLPGGGAGEPSERPLVPDQVSADVAAITLRRSWSGSPPCVHELLMHQRVRSHS